MKTTHYEFSIENPQKIFYEVTNMFENKELLTVNETAEYLGVCSKTVYKLIKDGTIFALKVGKSLRVPKSRLIGSLGTK